MQGELHQALDTLTGGIAAFVENQSEMNATFTAGGTAFQCVAFPSGKVAVGYLTTTNGDMVADTQWEIMVDPAAGSARPVAHETTLGRTNVDGDADATRQAVDSIRMAIRRFERGAMSDVEIV